MAVVTAVTVETTVAVEIELYLEVRSYIPTVFEKLLPKSFRKVAISDTFLATKMPE